jgi:sulfide:quinone oxidoreductase
MSVQTKKVLIAGGGVAALEAALTLRALAEDRVEVELLAPEPLFWYRPLSVAEPFRVGEAKHFELQGLAAAAGARFSPGTVVGVDGSRRLAVTSSGTTLAYDALLIACGAVPKPAVSGALTFRGPADTDKVRELLAHTVAGEVRQIAFAVPWGAVWTLPAYELALLTSAHLAAAGVDDVALALVTPEDEPLGLFGRAATEAVTGLLAKRGVEVHTRSHPVRHEDGSLYLIPERTLAAERVIALPRLQGQRIDGVPQTVDGFIPVDVHGRVYGLEDVYAAGDITSFPVKQGGIAAQQAAAAAEAIAAQAGSDVEPNPFRPVLRGLLLTGGRPQYFRQDITGGVGDTSITSEEALWWPPSKIVGRYLAPFLAEFAGAAAPRDAEPPPGAVAVEVDLNERDVDRLLEPPPAPAPASAERTVADVMRADPLVVAPEDTLGQAADLMREADLGSALVADFGRLIGIITSRDLLRAFAARAHPSEARIREWMTAQPVTVTADTSLEQAQLLMSEYGFHHLPVVGDEERPLGMVGLRDVAGPGASPGGRIRVGLGL